MCQNTAGVIGSQRLYDLYGNNLIHPPTRTNAGSTRIFQVQNCQSVVHCICFPSVVFSIFSLENKLVNMCLLCTVPGNSLCPVWDGENVTPSKVIRDLQLGDQQVTLNPRSSFPHLWQVGGQGLTRCRRAPGMNVVRFRDVFFWGRRYTP